MRLQVPAFSGHATIYLGAAIVSAAIPYLLLPFLTRWLGPADFGIIGSFVALVNVLALLVALNSHGLISVVVFADGPAKAREQTSSAAAIVVFMTVLVVATGYIFKERVVSLIGFEFAWYAVACAAALGQGLMAIALVTAQTNKRPLTYGLIQVGYGALLFALTIFLIAVLELDWKGRLLAQGAVALLIAIAGMCWLAYTNKLAWTISQHSLKASLGFGLPLLPHSLAVVAMGSIDRIVLGTAVSMASLGHYFLAIQIASLFSVCAMAINQAWVPWLYERLARNGHSDWSEIKVALQVIGSLLIFGIIAMVLTAPWLVQLTGGAAFARSAILLQLLAPAAAFQSWTLLLSAFLYYRRRTILISTITVSTALVQGFLIYILLPFKTDGVALAIIATSLISALIMSLTCWNLFKKSPIEVHDVVTLHDTSIDPIINDQVKHF